MNYYLSINSIENEIIKLLIMEEVSKEYVAKYAEVLKSTITVNTEIYYFYRFCDICGNDWLLQTCNTLLFFLTLN